MSIHVRELWHNTRSKGQTLWLIAAGTAALYIAAIHPLLQRNANQVFHATAIGIDDSVGIAEQTRPTMMVYNGPPAAAGIVGGVPGGVAGKLRSAQTESPAPDAENADRKLVRTAALEIVVKTPEESLQAIYQMGDRLGGFLVSSQVTGAGSSQQASISIRVPAARFDEARGEIRKLALRVESDQVQAQDVTTQYVDQDVRLRNLRAQEAQYLSILKQASNVKDTLAVSEKLNEVRGEIEQQEAEFKVLSKQIETVAINVELRAEADTQVFGLHWRPLYQLKLAARDGLNALADYGTSMASVVFALPAAALWLITILLSAAAGWRILRWAARVFFTFPRKPSPGQSLAEKAVN